MHAVEKEIIDTTGYTSRKKYSDRQDYLGSILNAAVKLTDSDFDDLSDEAAAWINAAVQANNSKEEIPDFDEELPEDDDDGEETNVADEPESDPEEGPEDPEEETDPDEDESGDEDEPEEVVQTKSKAKEKPKKETKTKLIPPKAKPIKKSDLDNDPEVILDKWGCMEGSKNSRALILFERGATTKEVRDAIGGTYYNLIKKLVADGHYLEKEGSLMKITHKTDKAKQVSKKKK